MTWRTARLSQLQSSGLRSHVFAVLRPAQGVKRISFTKFGLKLFSKYEETGSMHKLGPRFLLGLSLGVLTLVGAAGCHREDPDTTTVANNAGPDPADANMAPVDNSQPQPAAAPAPAQGRVLGIRSQAQPQQTAEAYAPQPLAQQTAPPPPDQDQQAYQDAQ